MTNLIKVMSGQLKRVLSSFQNKPGLLGRWCHPQSNPLCDPLIKSDLANKDNDMSRPLLRSKTSKKKEEEGQKKEEEGRNVVTCLVDSKGFG